MPEPFIVEPYEDDPEAVIPEDILREIPIENTDSVAKQLVDNLRVSVSATEVKVTDHASF